MCHKSGITSYFSVTFFSTVCVQFTFVDEQPDFLGMLAEITRVATNQKTALLFGSPQAYCHIKFSAVGASFFVYCCVVAYGCRVYKAEVLHFHQTCTLQTSDGWLCARPGCDDDDKCETMLRIRCEVNNVMGNGSYELAWPEQHPRLQVKKHLSWRSHHDLLFPPFSSV